MNGRSLTLAALLSVLAAGCQRPNLDAYREYLSAVKGDSQGDGGGAVMATYLGVSTILFSDGETRLLVDGFSTRGAALEREGGSLRVAPDRGIIERSLERLGVERLDAVLVGHTHLDHALDAPEVARLTGARLLGSRSTINVGRGWGLPEAQLQQITPGEPIRIGSFVVTFVPSAHTSMRNGVDREEGAEIEAPLLFPARFTDFIEGGTYSIHIAHPRGQTLVQGSAGSLEGALEGYQADVVFLAITRLGELPAAEREAYFREVVLATGARRVVPTHWDDWTRSLDRPLRPWRRLLSDFDRAMDYLTEQRERGAISDLRLMQAWDSVVLY